MSSGTEVDIAALLVHGYPARACVGVQVTELQVGEAVGASTWVRAMLFDTSPAAFFAVELLSVLEMGCAPIRLGPSDASSSPLFFTGEEPCASGGSWQSLRAVLRRCIVPQERVRSRQQRRSLQPSYWSMAREKKWKNDCHGTLNVVSLGTLKWS